MPRAVQPGWVWDRVWGQMPEVPRVPEPLKPGHGLCVPFHVPSGAVTASKLLKPTQSKAEAVWTSNPEFILILITFNLLKWG